MRGRRRRILAFVLSAALACSMMPFSASTVSAEEPAQEQGAEILTETDVIVPEDPGLPDNEELLDGYVMNILGLNSGISTLANYGDKVLNEQEKAIYDQLKTSIAGIAANGGSTEFTFSWTFTYAELGLDGMPSTITDDIKAKISEKIGDINKVIDVLLVDCPYELYWFDKTRGWSAHDLYSGDGEGITLNRVLSLYVSDNYRGNNNEFMVDASRAQSAAAAAAKAKEIVDKYKDASDYQKLLGYKEEICKLTDYNHGAADNADTPYGDPWQLVYVFDGDKDTTVVCEGYAKAFQYLCDLTKFDTSSIVCYTITGIMEGGTGAGGHMWNIVTMPDGQNYLVDVTNSDDGTIGSDGTLFLAGGNGSVDNGYSFSNKSGYSITYSYDPETTSLYGSGADSILNLASAAYDPDAVTPLSAQLESSEVAYGTDVVLHVTGSPGKEVKVYSGDAEIGDWRFVNGALDIELNTLKYGFSPIEDPREEIYTPGKYTLTVQYVDVEVTEAQEVTFTVDYYTDESNPTAYSPTKPSKDNWYKSDVILQPPQGYSIADTAKADTNWGNEITVAGEGEIFKTYYLRNLNTGAIVRGYAKYSIDKTAPTELKADVFVQDTSATVTASAEDTLSDIKSYSLAYNSGGSSAPNIADQGNGKFAITGMEPQTEYQFTLTVTDKADNTESIPVAVSTSGKLSLAGAVVTVIGDYVYDGTGKVVSKDNVSVTLNGETVPETEYEVAFGDDLISAGTVTVTVTAKDNSENYTGTAEGSFEIAKRNVTITAKDQTITYGETIDEGMGQVEAAGLAEGDAVASVKLSADTSKVTDNGVITVADAEIQNAAKSDVTGNYNIAYKPGKLTVEKAKSSIAFADTYQTTKDYDTKPFAVPTEKELEIKGASYENVVFTWYDSTGNTALQGAPVDAGTYVLKASIPVSENTMASRAEKQIEIKKITIAEPEQFTFPDWPESGYVYDGTAKEPAVVVWIDKEKTVQLPAEEYTVEYVKNINAGNGAKVVIKNTEDSKNCTIDYTKLFSISPASTSIRLDVPETAVYGEDISLTAVLTGIGKTDMPEGSVTFTVDQEEYTVDIVNGRAVLPAEKLSGIPAGDHAVTVSYPGKDNYAEAKAEGTLSVQKADPDVGDVSYNGETLYSTDDPTGVQLDKTGEAAGTLKLADGTVFEPDRTEYVWVFIPEDTEHYNEVSGTIDLAIQANPPAAMKITGTPDRSGYSYGDSFDPTGLMVEITYKNGLVRTIPASALGIVYEQGSFLTVGDESVTVTYAHDGAEVSAVITGLTVTAKKVADPTVELEKDTYIYDGTAKKPGVTVKDGSTVIPADEYTVTYTDNVSVGTASVTIADNEGGNYEIAEKTVTFRIVAKEQSGGQNGSQTGTGGDKAVKTGDSTGIMLWLMLAAMSGFSVAGACAWRKRRRV